MSANISKWYMSDEEIKSSYRTCKDARAQIGILAELNCKTKEEVKKKLAEIGVEISRTAARPSRFTETDRRKIYKMRHDENRAYSVIASIIGKATAESVRNEYLQMNREHIEARDLIERACRFYIKAKKTSESETRLLEDLIGRGI